MPPRIPRPDKHIQNENPYDEKELESDSFNEGDDEDDTDSGVL